MADRYAGLFGPSDRALEFGAKYAEVLAQWGELFAASSRLVQGNVELGRMARDAAGEFEQWIQQTATAPWSWMNPEMLQRFMRGASGSGSSSGS